MGDTEKLVINWKAQVSPLAVRRADSERTAAGRAPVWLWPNLLSLDAPLVAVGWEILAVRSYGERVSPAATLTLALAVWLIYVADRIFDALKSTTTEGLAARHRFYRAHWRAFVPALAAGVPLGAWLAWTRLDAATFRHGLWLLGAVAIYFGAVHLVPPHWLTIPKELAVAALFAAGCFLPAWQGNKVPGLEMILAWMLFVLVCWINSALIEHTEWKRLRRFERDAPHAWSAVVGNHPVAAAAAVALAAVLLAPLSAENQPQALLLATVLAALGLAMLAVRKNRISANAVRVLADFALLSPVLLLPFLR